MTTKSKIAVVGCGRIAVHNCKAIAENEGTELAAVCDLVEDKASECGMRFDVPWYTDYRTMLDSHSDVDL